MKKGILSILITVCSIVTALSQVAYYDALKLKSFLEQNPLPGGGTVTQFQTGHLPEVYQILKNYTLNSTTGNPAGTDEEIQKMFCPAADSNVFICQYFPGTPAEPALVASKVFNAIGNADITTFADGLAKFLIKRSKEEMFVTFFSKLKDDKTFPEFKVLFPNTKLLVDNFESWEYANILNTLREAFDKDLKSILADIPKLGELNTASCNCNNEAKKRIDTLTQFLGTDEGRIFLSACQVGNAFIANQKIADVIHTISGPRYLGGITSTSADVKNAIQLLDIVSYSLRNNEQDKQYVPLTDFNAAIGDADTRNLYFGLLWQQFKNRNISIAGKSLTALLTPANVSNVQSFATNILSETDNITTAFKNLAEAKKKGETDLTNYWSAVFESAKGFLQASSNIGVIDPSFQFPAELRTTLSVSTQALEVAHDISLRNYSGAVIGVLNFLKNTGDSEGAKGLRAFIVKYGSFAANIVEAKNSDDMENAIESVALPVGSASIKKHSEWNIALNAYLGGFVGNEFLADKSSEQWAAISGIMAPVGVTFSHRLGKASLSAYLSIIDIGAFASYRLKDEKTEKLPEVQLKNIFAPGLGLVLGIPGVPLSVGYIHQLGPALREISADKLTVSEKMNHRWMFFLGVDIPLLNFYSKSSVRVTR